MRSSCITGLCAAALLAIMPWQSVAAQEAPSQPNEAGDPAPMAAMPDLMQLSPEHQELATMVGTWRVTARFWANPAAPPETSEATAVRSMTQGGRVLEEVYTSMIMGQPFEGRGLTGYDRLTGQYWSVWIDNMNDGASVTYGGFNETDDAIVMEGEVPSLMMGRVMPVRIEFQMDGPDRTVHAFFTPDPSGTMVQYMELVYERE